VRTTGWKSVLVGGGLVLAQVSTTGLALGDEHPRRSKAVRAVAQGGGGGTAPVSGAPPVVEPPKETPSARATAAPASRSGRAGPKRSRLIAVSFADREATLEVDGVREVVRAGSRLGEDMVRSVSPGRIVLERAATPGEPGGPALVLVTFDETGRGRTQVFWSVDPAAVSSGEVKRP
jgi:hypothetical protein